MSSALILVVEDNERSRRLLRDVLEHRGYRVLAAETGEEGVALARAQVPALVLMDIQLPGISGIEAFAQLQADAATRGIPVVAVTASAMQEEREQIQRVGFAGYETKPIRVMEFLKMVETVLAAHASGGQRA